MTITVVNRKHYKDPNELAGYTYIGRPHPLSNPYRLNKAGDNREEVVKRYGAEKLKPALLARGGEVWDALYALAERHSRGEVIHLGCSCKLKRPEDREGYEDLACHADAAKKAIDWIAGQCFKPITLAKVEHKIEVERAGVGIELNARVRHINPEVVSRLKQVGGQVYGAYYCTRYEEGSRPRREGLVVMTSASHPWDCPPNSVKVLWDDLAEDYIEIENPAKYDWRVTLTKGTPTTMPVKLLQRI